MPWIGGVVAGVGSLASGLIGSSAAGDASKTQAAATDRATQAELDMYGQTVAREQPFVQAGTNALPQLLQLLGLQPGSAGPSSPLLAMLGIGPGGATGGGIDPRTFQGDPGYRYRVGEADNAVTNAASRTGGILGGNALKALQANSQGLANQNWQQYLTDVNTGWQGLLGNVSNIVASGQNAAGNLGTVGTGVANQVGSNIMRGGNALAGGQIDSASATAGGMNGALQTLITAMKGGEFKNLFGSGNSSYVSLDPTNQSVNSQYAGYNAPDSAFLPGGQYYQG